jgi:hypothetical protein
MLTVVRIKLLLNVKIGLLKPAVEFTSGSTDFVPDEDIAFDDFQIA